ncbi:site-specific integrase [Falsirhodobacter halotolerans]|uniref:site-specific integrase n=1 Tax=Falsirhodobacter halotolerans TaxID=1146892 RepID=UPI001FCFDCFE|nr:site-specific integrase [Falsirhodobacter halotolerans]MCJ8139489.1 site-specific integrase [Falsirhodobacter halotolerans]
MERLPSGNIRHRVRVEGRKAIKITIPVGPDHPDFIEHYYAARAGGKWTPEVKPSVPAHSLRWLVDAYLMNLSAEVDAKLKSASTLRQRRSQLTRLCDIPDRDGTPYGDLHLDMPQAAFVQVRDHMIRTPAEADNTMKAVRAMYEFAIERRDTYGVETNPAKGIRKIHISAGGTKPWTASDLKAFRETHPAGTMPHLWLTLLMMTGCRIGDARILGRGHEVQRDGITWLEWQPGKKGSAPVTLPMAPPLQRAVRNMVVQGETYLLSERGRPFGTVESLRQRVRRWCDAAGLVERSSHGLRKALAELLAEVGCSDHQIMSVLAHTNPNTTAIYTRGAKRRVLALDAMAALDRINW